MSVPASALPSVMKNRLAAMEAAEATPAAPVAPAAPATPAQPAVAPATPATPEASNAQTVTLSREEYNDLQANAGKTQKALAQAEAAKLAQEEMAHRLTELEKAAKSTPAPATPAPALAAEDVSFTEDEEKEFGDSKGFISKVVRQELGKALAPFNKLLDELRGEVNTAKQTAASATTSVVQRAEKEFFDKVNKAVPSLSAITKHKNWNDFLDETDELTGATYEQLLAHNVKRENLQAVTAIYKKFSDKYTPANSDIATGYAGATPSGNTDGRTATNAEPVKLKFSDRKKASEDYRKGKITYDQLQEVVKKFDEAEKLNNVDYNT